MSPNKIADESAIQSVVSHLTSLGHNIESDNWLVIRSTPLRTDVRHPVHGEYGLDASGQVIGSFPVEQAIEELRADPLSPDVAKVLTAMHDVTYGSGARWSHALQSSTLAKIVASPVAQSVADDIPRTLLFSFVDSSSVVSSRHDPSDPDSSAEGCLIRFGLTPAAQTLLDPRRGVDVGYCVATSWGLIPKAKVTHPEACRTTLEISGRDDPEEVVVAVSNTTLTIRELIAGLRSLGATHDAKACASCAPAVPPALEALDTSKPPTALDADRILNILDATPGLRPKQRIVASSQFAWAAPKIAGALTFSFSEMSYEEYYSASPSPNTSANDMMLLRVSNAATQTMADPLVVSAILGPSVVGDPEEDEGGELLFPMNHAGSLQDVINDLTAQGLTYEKNSCGLAYATAQNPPQAASSAQAPSPQPKDMTQQENITRLLENDNAPRLAQLLQSGLDPRISVGGTSDEDENEDEDEDEYGGYHHQKSVVEQCVDIGAPDCFSVLAQAISGRWPPVVANACAKAMTGDGHQLARPFRSFLRPFIQSVGPGMSVETAATLIQWSMSVPPAKANPQERDGLYGDLTAVLSPASFQAAVLRAVAQEPKGWAVMPWSADVCTLIANDPYAITRPGSSGGSPISVAVDRGDHGAVRAMVQKSGLAPSAIMLDGGTNLLQHVRNMLEGPKQSSAGMGAPSHAIMMGGMMGALMGGGMPRHAGPSAQNSLNQVKMLAQSMEMLEKIAQNKKAAPRRPGP